MSSVNSTLLVSCKNKAGVEKHYFPALKAAGWTGPIQLVAPGDPVPDLTTSQAFCSRAATTSIPAIGTPPSPCIRKPMWMRTAMPSRSP